MLKALFSMKSDEIHETAYLIIIMNVVKLKSFKYWYYLPTPPLGQDMTQGQFLSGV